MSNVADRDAQAAWAYHNGTKHSYASVRSGRHTLDWDNRPLPFKIYRGLEALPLPQDLAHSPLPALDALARVVAAGGTPDVAPVLPDLRTLATLLYFAAGITRRVRHPGGEMLFRAAACTGALYHIELYVICGDLPGLPAGVYHCGMHDFALRRLRAGDFRGVIADATGAEPATARAPAIIACTSTFWRNAWKYRARTYRHCFWDCGTILANLLAVAAAHGIPARVVVGFVDDMLNRLLGLDPDREVTLALIPLGAAPDANTPVPPVEKLVLETEPLSRHEVQYPAIRAVHAASSFSRPEDASAWRAAVEGQPDAPPPTAPAAARELIPLEPAADLPAESVERVILRRGSTRRFERRTITFAQLSTILDRGMRLISRDYGRPDAALTDAYVVVHAVDGLAPGAYAYHPHLRALALLKAGDFRATAGYLALEQALAADAAADVFFLADLHHIFAYLGGRGYRAAQLEGGILGGRLYLAAYALRLGASGLTFYDDDVTAFFSPHAAGKSVMFLTALGRPQRRRS